MLDFIDSFTDKFRLQTSGTQYRNVWQLLHLDVPLLISLLVLMLVGAMILYSAGNGQLTLIAQMVFNTCVALLVLVVMAQIPPSKYFRLAPWMYVAGMAMLIVVMLIGHSGKGAQRWLHLGAFNLQPSEFMKIIVPMTLAWYFSDRQLPPSYRDVGVAAIIILLPAAIIAKQPDLGTAIVLVLSGFVVLLLAGMRWWWMFSIAAFAAILAPIAWKFMHTYQQNRILIFLNPEIDPLNTGYHIIQSKIAIGSGGMFGKGWLHGTQSHLHFLPENITDFIFAACAEEFGLLGCLGLIAIYLVITFRCVYIALMAQDTFSRLLAGCLGLTFFMSVFVNMGMVSGILPVVGLPLPLVSYGGSSMVTTLACFGIIMSIHGHRNLLGK